MPKLRKKIIYLDQLMISEMMKSLNSQNKANQANRVRGEWHTAFEKLDVVSKLQLAICPDSLYHYRESYVNPHYAALKRIYELLSHGVTFHDAISIKSAQLDRHVRDWLSKSPNTSLIERSDALPSNTDDWQDTIRVTIKSDYVSDFADDFRKGRADANARMQKLFTGWQRETTKKLSDWYEPEVQEFGIGLVEQHDAFVLRRQRIQSGETTPTDEDFWPPLAFHQVRTIFQFLVEEAGDVEKGRILATDYFRTADFSLIPFVRISALLLAGVARRAAAGQKRLPTQGMVNDINMTATLLPYCDAMFLDKEIHGLLREGDIRGRLGFETKIYSPADFDGFFAYLDEIRSSMTTNHLEKVHEVYGPEADKPFVDVFEVDAEAAAPRPIS